jgi:hypothetical protein
MFSSDSIFSIGWEVHPIEKIESATALIFHSRAEAGSFLFFRLASLDSAAACFTGRRRALRLGTCDVATIRPGLQHLIWRHWRRQTGTSTEMVVVRPEQDYFFLLMASYDMLSNMT